MYGKTVCPPTCTITIPASTAQNAQLIVVQKDVTVHMTEELVAKLQKHTQIETETLIR